MRGGDKNNARGGGSVAGVWQRVGGRDFEEGGEDSSACRALRKEEGAEKN